MRKLFNTRVITAVVSAISAIVCAVLAGCKMYVGELALKDANAEIMSIYCNTNGVAK